MIQYIDNTIQNQTDILKRFEIKLQENDPTTGLMFDETVRFTMQSWVGDREEMTKRDFMRWRNKLYSEELSVIKGQLRALILGRSADIVFPSSFDKEDSVALVNQTLDLFTHECEQQQQNRRVAKRQFVIRISRPLLSVAFYSVSHLLLYIHSFSSPHILSEIDQINNVTDVLIHAFMHRKCLFSGRWQADQLGRNETPAQSRCL